jgi:hypothetical protein
VDFREAGLVTHDAMAANTHGVLFGSRLHITLHTLSMSSENGHRSDKRGGQRQEKFVHFAMTITE